MNDRLPVQMGEAHPMGKVFTHRKVPPGEFLMLCVDT